MSALVLGWGCVAASGFGPDELERAADGPPAQRFGAVADPERYLTMRGLRPLARASRLALIAAAAATGSLERPSAEARRYAVVVGTQWGSLEPLADFDRAAARDGPRLANPAAFPNVVANVHAGYLGILLGLAGPNVTVCGRGAGLEAVGHALDLLETGRAEYVLAGGTEAPGETLLQGLASADGTASTPAGEGAAFLLLARDRDARSPLAACLACASHTVHEPESAGPARAAAVADALAGARVTEAWYSGERPEDGVVDGARLRTVQAAAGDCRGAGGALAATLAAFSAARRRRPVAALDFPPVGTQSAALLAPV